MTSKAKKPSLEDEVRSALKWLKSHSTKTTLDGMARYPTCRKFSIASGELVT